MPLTPIVWKDRLFVFWLKIIKQNSASPTTSGLSLDPSSNVKSSNNINDMSLDNLQSFGSSASQTQSQNGVMIQAALCWSEYYNGKWQPTKTSDINRPVTIGLFSTGSFEAERNRIRIVPAQCTGNNPVVQVFNASFANLDGALILAIKVAPENPPEPTFWSLYANAHYVSAVYFDQEQPGAYRPPTGFVMYNTHSLPVCFEDVLGWAQVITPSEGFAMQVPIGSFLDVPVPNRVLHPSLPYTGGIQFDTLVIGYYSTIPSMVNSSPDYANTLLASNWGPRFVEPQVGTGDDWDAPFFFEDRRNLFYVKTTEDIQSWGSYDGYGLQKMANLPTAAVSFPPLVLDGPAGPSMGLNGNQAAGPPERSVGGSNTIRVAIASPATVTYQGHVIYSAGGIGVAARPSLVRANGGTGS
jgi:hypothetical protein